ncbi:MAG: alpha/beta hydrolase [Anaerolineae bacterium]
MSVYRYCLLWFSWLLFFVIWHVPTSSAQASPLRIVDCRFAYPVGVSIDCYQLDVPENRQLANSATVSLSVAILRSPAPRTAPYPIIFLQGGPGGTTLGTLTNTYTNRFAPLLANGYDVIVFDQRGIGNSTPRLDCEAYRVLDRDLLDYEDAEGNVLTRVDVDVRLQHALIACGMMLAQQHDLSGYNSIESASDIEAIRLAFGYQQVNLWGISYGTRLALTAMRDYPDSFRRVVLDSVYPLEANLYTELPVNFDRALQVLFTRCQSDWACQRTFPDLELILFETVTRLNAQPVRLNAPNPYTDQVFSDVVFNGDDFLRVIFQLLYVTDVLPRLPQLIYEAHADNLDVLAVLVGWLTAQRNSISIGMNYAVQCQEEISFTTSQSIQSAWAMFPQFASYSATVNTLDDLQTICEAFQAGTAPITENQPIQSAIPTLLIAGDYDPITPPHWAQQVAEQLPNSQYVNVPHGGHGASGSRGCVQSIVIDFFQLTDDDQELDSTCVTRQNMTFSGTQRGDFNPLDSAQIDHEHVFVAR